MENNNIIVTDIYLVAALFAYGADYVGVDREDKRNQKFMFKTQLGIPKIHITKHGVLSSIEMPDYSAVRLAYDAQQLMYPPNFPESIRRAKGIIHS